MLTKVVMRNPADLVPLVGNPNAMDAQAMSMLKASLRQHGLLENLVLQKGTAVVVGGNHRLLAIQAMMADGELPADTKVPCGEFEFTEEQMKKAAVALNRIGGDMLAGALRDFLEGVDFSNDVDLAEAGLERAELDALLGGTFGPEDVFGATYGGTQSLEADNFIHGLQGIGLSVDKQPNYGFHFSCTAETAAVIREALNQAIARLEAGALMKCDADSLALALICEEWTP
jgi:hypothetical protein